MWYVYALKCRNNQLYIGSTNDLIRRLHEHHSGKSIGSKNMLPCRLEFYLAVRAETKARSLEKYFKTGSGKAIIKKRFSTDEALA